MRKLAVMAAVSMAMSLTGCGSSEGDGGKRSSSSGIPQIETQVKAQAEDDGLTPKITGEFPEYHQTVAMSVAENTINYVVVKKFTEFLDEWSGGRITVNIYLGEQPGNTTEFTEVVIGGSTNIGTDMTTDLVDFMPSYTAFDMPDLSADMEQMKAVLSGGFVSVLDEYSNQGGIEIPGLSDIGFRQLTLNKPVHQLADLSGRKIRAMTNQYHIAYWNALDAAATPIQFTEVFMEFQQGIIGGEENLYMNTMGNNTQEVQKYVTEISHISHITTFSMNYSLYQDLPEDVRVLVDECAKGATAYANSKADESIVEHKKACGDAGYEVIILDDKVMGELREETPVVCSMARENTGDELADQLLTAINEAK